MKFLLNALMAAGLLAGSLANAEIVFDIPKQQPIVLELTTVDDSDGLFCIAHDREKRVRFVLSLNTSRYYYKSSSGTIESDFMLLHNNEHTQLKDIIRNISEQCPATISLDRDTLKILKVKSSCDPMATINAELPFG